jgi:hypothetical protein
MSFYESGCLKAVKKGEVFPVRAIKACKASRDMAQLILSLGLGGGQPLVQAPAALPLGKELQYPLYKRLGGPQG